MLGEFVFTNLDVEVLAVSSSLATVFIPVSPILIAMLPNCRVMLELYLLRTVTQRCLSWLFPCIPSCVPCSLDSHHPQSKAVAVLTRLDGFHAWSWGLSLSWGSPGSSLASHHLGFSPPRPPLSLCAPLRLCSFYHVALQISLIGMHEVGCSITQTHAASRCKLLCLHNTAQRCVTSLA